MNSTQTTPRMYVGGQRAYTSMEVVALSGLSYRQLDYAIRLGRVRPSIDEGVGSGHVRLFSARDVVKARLIQLTTPPWGFPPAWQGALLAHLDVADLADLADQLVVIVGGAAWFMTFDQFAGEQPLYKGMVTVIPCDQLLADLGDAT